MKVLVVDDDVVARKVLGAFLKQSNYEMQIVEDGLTALRVLTSPDAPPVAIVDWMMPDLTGPELCAQLRQQNAAFQPYLIMLSGRKDRADVVAALDAGADDFIAKPFNIQEMQARLRVAGRSVEHQLALHRRIATLEQQLAHPTTAAAATAAAAAPSPHPDVSMSAVSAEVRAVGVAALEPNQIDTVVASALRHCGLNHAPRRVAAGKISPPIAWASLLLLKEGSWVDLFLEMDRPSLVALWSKGRDRPVPGSNELAGFALSLQHSLRESLRSVLRAMGGEMLVPLPPQPIAAGEPPPHLPEDSAQRHHYRVGSAILTFMLVQHPSPLLPKNTDQLQLFDVLASPYPPANTHQVPLLRGGVVLKDHLIEKLRRFAEDAADVPPVPVHRPSDLALEYHREPARAR